MMDALSALLSESAADTDPAEIRTNTTTHTMLNRSIRTEDAAPQSKIQAALQTARGIALVFTCAVVLSCAANREDDKVVLPATPVISVRPQWAVANQLYTRVYAAPETSSSINGHLRLGDVASILAITANVRSDGLSELWFRVQMRELEGWIPGGGLEFYESERRANNASVFVRRRGADE